MKSIVSIAAALVAGVTATATSHADVKNVGGMVCKHYANSEAPKSAEHITFTGHLCNDSSTQRLRVTCPLTQDLGSGEAIHATFDYVNWNLNGINGKQNTYPEQEFLCSIFTRTRYAQAYFWGNWKSAADFPGYGATPTAMYAVASMLDDGFSHGVCYIPRKYDNKRSCVSHIKYNEQ